MEVCEISNQIPSYLELILCLCCMSSYGKVGIYNVIEGYPVVGLSLAWISVGCGALVSPELIPYHSGPLIANFLLLQNP